MSKPHDCPFCGSASVIMTHRTVSDHTGGSVRRVERWHKRCYVCGASGPIKPTSNEAAAAWDHRTGEVIHDSEYKTNVRPSSWLWDVRPGPGLSGLEDSHLGE